MQYPPTPAGNHVDHLHGRAIPDPYRWLEDLDSPETRAWIEAQNQLTFDYLARIPPRERIRERLQELMDFNKYSLPRCENGRYFYTCKQGLQNQAVLYWQEGLTGEATVLLDPNTLSEDGTLAMNDFQPSPDGGKVAYSLSAGGSDWQTWRVRCVDSAADLPDVIEWSKFSSAAWSADSQGFYYSRYAAPAQGEALKSSNYYHQLYYHRLGTSQSEDRLVYERPDQKTWGFSAQVTDDGRYLVVTVWEGTERENGIFYRDLQDSNGKMIELLNAFDAEYKFFGSQGSRFYFTTDLDAPKGRIIAVDTHQPQIVEIVPPCSEALTDAALVGGQFFASYLKDAYNDVRRYALDGSLLGTVSLPGIGTTLGFGGKDSDRETFYGFTNFITPLTIYRYDLFNEQSSVFRQPEMLFNPQDYLVRQVFYASKDGMGVPMFLAHRKDVAPTGDNPTLLYGYGGFNIPQTPVFSVQALAWMEMGGVFVVANLRGGGEYGSEWHDMGRLHNKQTVFDDFIAAAEYLVQDKITNPSRLAIQGRSNGGLLVGACLTQRPDLFAACLPAVGVLDMLRFHKFTIGWAWVSDYGDPDNPEDFETLLKYSPYHNVRAGVKYPATLIATGDHDDRVFPAHSFKFAAALQAAAAQTAEISDRPLLIRIETRAGHGMGKPKDAAALEFADQLAFAAHHTGLRVDVDAAP